MRTPCLFPRGEFGLGWLYLLQRSDGIVKLGYTRRPRARFQQHRTLAKSQGRSIVRFHLFGVQEGRAAILAERKALQALTTLGERIETTETFRGIEFTAALRVVRQAQQEA